MKQKVKIKGKRETNEYEYTDTINVNSFIKYIKLKKKVCIIYLKYV